MHLLLPTMSLHASPEDLHLSLQRNENGERNAH